MSHLLLAEFYKLRHDRLWWGVLLLLVAATVGMAVFILLVEASELTVEELYILGFEGNALVVLLVPCLLAGSLISGEHAFGTMKNMATSGNSRFRLYFAKLIAFSSAAAIISLVLPCVMIGVGAIWYGGEGMPALGYVMKTMLLTVLCAVALAAIMTAIAASIRNSGVTIAVLFFLNLALMEILPVVSRKSVWVERVYENSIFKLLPLIPYAEGWLHVLLVPVLTLLFFGWLGAFVFQRIEIK